MQKITLIQLRVAVERAGLDSYTFDRIQTALLSEPQDAPNFEPAHISYYLGALLIIGAMGWFITSAWDTLSGFTIFLIAALYAVVFGLVGKKLFDKPHTRIPGGLLVTVAVCMTPLAIYGIERACGWWPSNDPGSYTRFHPYINASWIVMELGTILAAAIALYFVRFGFVTAPAAYALWYLSMDATAFLFGVHWSFRQMCQISVAFGVVMLIAAYFLDRETGLDLSFWFYLFGLLTFTGGLTLMGDGNQLGKALYCLIHLVLMVLAVILQRKVFLVFGAIGVFVYLMGEAEGYFRNSFGFTISLTLIGAAFIAAGIFYKRNEALLQQKLAPFVPSKIRNRHAPVASS
jgi:hypothetical protein